MYDKRDRAITCVFCRDLQLNQCFLVLYKKICLKESEVWRKVVSNKIIVTLVHKVCRLLSSPVLLRKCTKLADLATERERHLTTGKRPERTKLDFRYPIAALPLVNSVV